MRKLQLQAHFRARSTKYHIHVYVYSICRNIQLQCTIFRVTSTRTRQSHSPVYSSHKINYYFDRCLQICIPQSSYHYRQWKYESHTYYNRTCMNIQLPYLYTVQRYKLPFTHTISCIIIIIPAHLRYALRVN